MKKNLLTNGEVSSCIKNDERLDSLELDNLMIIQKKSGYRFSTDSVLLSNFVKAKPSDFYVDLCSGSGVVAILVAHKNKLKNAHCVEIQSEICDMSKRSIEYDKLSDKIQVHCADLSNAHKILGSEVADVISVNPPYNPDGLTSDVDEIKISTHEIKTNLKDICKACFKLLRYGGKLYMVHRADRLVDILSELRKNNLEPKVLRIVYPKLSKNPNLVLISATKGAKSGLLISSPLVIMDEAGNETEELKKIYNRKS